MAMPALASYGINASVTPAPTSRLTPEATRALYWEITARWAIPAILRSSTSAT